VKIEAGLILDSTTTLMATMLPVVFLDCIYIPFVLLTFIFIAFSNEHRHLLIIRRFGGLGKNGVGSFEIVRYLMSRFSHHAFKENYQGQ
jgi:hypothetical protein